MGHTHEVVSLDDPDDTEVDAYSFKIYALGSRAPFYRNLRKAVPWLRYGYTPHFVPWLKANRANYDVVIINGLWNYTAFGAWLGLRGGTTPYVVFTHGMLDPWFRKTYPLKHIAKQFFWWFSEGRLLRNAAAVLFTTEDERELARGAFWPYHVKGVVVGYGTANVTGDSVKQVRAFREHLPALGKRKFLLFLSRIHPKKGCDLLIRAFAKIASERPDTDLVIAGPDQVGWKKELQGLAKDHGIADRIHWPGMLVGDPKWGAFYACEAFVLISHQENFGIVVAEAMACAKPVLISEKVNIWREIVAARAGLVAPDTQQGADDLIMKFFQLSSNEVRSMSMAAQSCFSSHFEISVSAKNVLKTIAPSFHS
jgi:glycosyltransferase involved in cell wall biosynthesis